MNISHFLLDKLNEKQREAVTASRKNLLILAGAGSGKTRVLTYRIAWLQHVANNPSCSIMAVTFTKKAATEMRNRVAQLIDINSNQDTWIGTFHSLAHRLLRIHYMDANLPKDFQILDSDDQVRLLKRLFKDMNLDEKKWSIHQAIWYISNKKDLGIRPNSQHFIDHPIEKTWQKIYQSYQETCNRAGLVDFSELLLRSYELWLNKPHVLKYYRERFTNILVDEFQDTNYIQYEWIRLLVGNIGKIMIVGDDDQSIYGWRGAKIENIQRFIKDFPNAKIIRLEQNYRSTSNILTAANTLIENNNGRLGKKLWTDEANGEPISLYCAFNKSEEAHFIVRCIKDWTKQGSKLSQCAILYRSNAQSRILEEALLQENIPYQIYGGIRFFERQEIKDVLSYLRLILNHNDDIAFERIINVPNRGIGSRTLSIIHQISRDNHLTFWQASLKSLQDKILLGRTSNALKNFLQLIESLKEEIVNVPLHIQTNRVIKDSGLWMMYKKEKGEKGKICIENLKELIAATLQFSYNNEDKDKDKNMMPLQAFLSHVVLEPEEGKVNVWNDAVQLMTLHSAKGLEFQKVFIVGMEEGIFPNQISIGDNGQLEEERRLAYVGITRAMQKLTLTYAETNRIYGKEVRRHPSRFINELPKECIQEVIHTHTNIRYPINISNQKVKMSISEERIIYRIDQCVRHAKFGEGKIIKLKGSGKYSLLQVQFKEQGIKWLIAAYANLEII